MKTLFWKKPTFSLYHFSLRLFLFGGGLLLLSFMLYFEQRPFNSKYQEGDIALENIYAPFNFLYSPGIDEAKTRALKAQAQAAVKNVFELSAQINHASRQKLRAFLEQVQELQKTEGLIEQDKLVNLKEKFPLGLSDEVLKFFLKEKDFAKLAAEIYKACEIVLKNGVLESKIKESLLKGGERTLQIIYSPGQEEETSLAKISTESDLPTLIENALSAIQDRKVRENTAALLKSILQPNLVFNVAETEKRRNQAQEAIIPVPLEIQVKKDELIIQKGEKVDKDALLQLKEINKRQTNLNQAYLFWGALAFSLLILLFAALYLKNCEKNIYTRYGPISLLLCIGALVLFIAKGITFSPLSIYYIPVSLGAMLSMLLLGRPATLSLSIFLSIYLGILANASDLATLTLIDGLIGAVYLYRVKRRSQILSAGFIIGLANFILLFSIGLYYNLSLQTILRNSFISFTSGVVSAGLALFLLPIFENIFQLTTGITLLELSDLNHPALKQLFLQAPGTYTHSLVVSNLAESAAEAIGANGLLARVGAYFHDIGKIEKAEYFSENFPPEDKTRHDKLEPSMSRLIIINHVKEGVELASKNRLPKLIINLIAEHHGTSVIHYFYQRALEKVEEKEEVKEESYRYPGPRPQTKEAAIILLADSVEAASRTLSEPTPARIESLVTTVINNKFIDGQLDECELTLKDLYKIAQTFSHILTGIFHSRIAYPANNAAGS
jgi:putative nucleotidyltransferase with HDIG domain